MRRRRAGPAPPLDSAACKAAARSQNCTPIGETKVTKLKHDARTLRFEATITAAQKAISRSLQVNAIRNESYIAAAKPDVADQEREPAVVDPCGDHHLDPDLRGDAPVAEARVDHPPPAHAVAQRVVARGHR